MKSEIKTAIILAVVIGVGIAAISVAFSTLDQASVANISGDSSQIDKSGFKKAPDLVGIAHYLNTTPEELAQEMEGKVILYDIWTYSCINCIRTLPYITAWDDKYSDQGLLIIGIHSPEFEFEKVPENVKMSIEKHGINYPVVMDNEMETWKAFENRYWPRKYIADHEGYIRYDHIGEGGYQETEKVIQQLIKERSDALGIQMASASSLVDIEEFEHTLFRTPELYFGYYFAQNRNQLGSEEGFQPEKTVVYKESDKIELHKFYPIGTWKNHEDSMELISETGEIKLLYNAKEVNIVTANNAELEMYLDGEPLPEQYSGSDITSENTLSVSEPGLYNIITSEESASHVLEIKVKGMGFQIFTFTFG
ncbi:Thiol-disulfide oxidoreductase ResA protein [Marine Group I thaumarchaeote SCGC AAA799-E16]|uniref:Thiol-disulfide oxidoreductase ResA protein n=4 Tax=Marine Group I TaxID=905826 RepID=A0A087S7F7_9ARCH|nr:Thiol-disulfide oxidoreductase ResA protein [Marine Group I thaumarchaeote SCGC AAA799-N04]KER05991.1 Thiol-disulfide oxidoreductase ResA protein [Marine Group I thaumarchaeote SCGC AAA799-E16]KFM18026.1 redoxin domain-containing protein [Marine Group I thaumarchaeote SCGC RSA3]KFM21661.1 Thiol-disulfide oxidoreductase ResA protein [Marine Group I thaumarchaeote SCGC AAA799-B03]